MLAIRFIQSIIKTRDIRQTCRQCRQRRGLSDRSILINFIFQDFTGIREDSLSPESAYSDVQSPLSIQSCVTSPGTSASPMDTTMSPNEICGDKTFDRSDDIGTESDLNFTDQSFQSLSMRNEFSFDSTRQR